MTTFVNEQYDRIYKINQNMLALAQQGKWDDFVTLAENYIITLRSALDQTPATLSSEEKEQLCGLLMALQGNEAEIKAVLEARLDFLRKDISSLHQGKKCSQAYNSQVVSPFQSSSHR
jgi:flagellar protein FliT